MSHSIVITANAPKALVDAASMQGLDLNFYRLSAYCHDDAELDECIRYAEANGVEIKGISRSTLKQSRFELGSFSPIFFFILCLVLGVALVALLPSSLLLAKITMALLAAF